MPKAELFQNEDKAKEHIERLMVAPEVQDFFDAGLKMGLTVVEIDGIDNSKSDHPMILSSDFDNASQLWQWDVLMTLCRTCSATWRTKTNTLYCMRYGPKHVAAIDFVDTDERVGALHGRFINTCRLEAAPMKSVIGTPFLSVGGASYKEMNRVDWPGMLDVCQSRVREAKQKGKNKIVNAPGGTAVLYTGSTDIDYDKPDADDVSQGGGY